MFAGTIHRPNIGLLLGQRLLRRPSVKPTLQCINVPWLLNQFSSESLALMVSLCSKSDNSGTADILEEDVIGRDGHLDLWHA